MELNDKWVWVTGASSGIGKAIAIELSFHKANLVLMSRNVSELKKTADACNPNVNIIIQPIDLADNASIDEAVRVLLHDKKIPPHILINNGGISQRATAGHRGCSDPQDIRHQLFRHGISYQGTTAKDD